MTTCSLSRSDTTSTVKFVRSLHRAPRDQADTAVEPMAVAEQGPCIAGQPDRGASEAESRHERNGQRHC